MPNQFLGPKKLPLTQYEQRLGGMPQSVVEEGLLEYIFSKIEPTHKFCVELGAGDGVTWSFSRYFIEEKGWGGLLIEGGHERAQTLKERYKNNENVTTIESFITAENICELLKEAEVPWDVDYLVIDLDGNDYYIWDKLEDYKPKVICVEYNASYGPKKKFKIDYDPKFEWQEDDYFGASFASFLELGESRGYTLIHCTVNGDNMFFVRNDFIARFPEVSGPAEKLYQPPLYRKYGRALSGKGHPVSTKNSTAAYRTFCKARYMLMTPLRKVAYLMAKLQGIDAKQ